MPTRRPVGNGSGSGSYSEIVTFPLQTGTVILTVPRLA